jgi:hypothetical protein
MRISFDIDDTLVCGPGVPTEQFVPWLLRWRYREKLRRGTRDLMHELVRRRCDVWIYTTSLRASRRLRGWFASFGVRLGGVVNLRRHEEVVGCRGPSKYPPAFGIDLHIDDSPGVADEGRRHGFRVLLVSPHDFQWATRVLAAAEQLAQQAHRRRTG